VSAARSLAYSRPFGHREAFEIDFKISKPGLFQTAKRMKARKVNFLAGDSSRILV
jgi:hypothetical protein